MFFYVNLKSILNFICCLYSLGMLPKQSRDSRNLMGPSVQTRKPPHELLQMEVKGSCLEGGVGNKKQVGIL